MTRISKIFGVLAVIMLMSGSVYAADQGAQSFVDYSGIYIGALAGYSWVDLEYQESDDSDFDRSPNFDGFVGGIFLGYNYQDNNVVYGVEADAGLGDLSEGPDKNSSNNDWSSFDIDWNAHVRARAGLVYDATLFYVTGGLAIAGVSVDDNDPGWSDDNATHVGWTVGCGIDRLLTENLTVRFEYLYDDYGSEEYSFNGSFNYKGDVDLTSHTTRIGLSYTF